MHKEASKSNMRGGSVSITDGTDVLIMQFRLPYVAWYTYQDS